MGGEKHELCRQLAQEKEEKIAMETSTREKFRLSPWLLGFCALWAVAFTSFLGVAVYSDGTAVDRAFYSMILGLFLLWIILCGWLMRLFRAPIRRFVLGIPWAWQAKFILFCILLALLEEAITTSMTNLAPVFGVAYGQAYITASGNYFDVVLLHSVMVFVPMFVAWVFLLGRWNFSPSAALICFGITGTLGETISFGAQNLINAGFWILVYGLMLYLPVYCLPEREKVQAPRWWHYPIAIIFPIIFALPFIIILGLIHSILGHPAIHF